MTILRLICGMVWTFGASPTYEPGLANYCDYLTYIVAYGETNFRLFDSLFFLFHSPCHNLARYQFIIYLDFSVSFVIMIVLLVASCCCCAFALAMAFCTKYTPVSQRDIATWVFNCDSQSLLSPSSVTSNRDVCASIHFRRTAWMKRRSDNYDMDLVAPQQWSSHKCRITQIIQPEMSNTDKLSKRRISRFLSFDGSGDGIFT